MKSSALLTGKNPLKGGKPGKDACKNRPDRKTDGTENDMHLKLEPSIISGNDVLSVSHLSKSFPEQTLFEDISFELKRGEHVAIIGDNGTGKTTLLKILNEVLPADSGRLPLVLTLR